MWDNYPPGVSGSEYEIAGADFERDEERECGEAVLQVPWHLFERAISLAKRLGAGQPEVKELLDLAGLAQDEAPCGFVGMVTVSGFRGESWWTCPACGREHDDESA